MVFEENVELSKYSTMRLGGNARYFCTIISIKELVESVNFAKQKNIKIKMIGGGSNIIWSDAGFNGLVIENRINYIKISDEIVQIGAGMEWDEVVEKTVESGLSGIEYLSFIPGSTGATPIQNVGAYGAEIADVFQYLKAYDLEKSEFVELQAKECAFGYRKSRFNRQDKGRFLISEVVLKLSKINPSPPFYKVLKNYLDENNITDYSPQAIRNAVIYIRKNKLPDPSETANNGSFFTNPIINEQESKRLMEDYPDLPIWEFEGQYKISAAWLIDKAGFNDYHDKETGMATWQKQPLVLINENAESTSDLLKFRDKIISAVDEKFKIRLVQEPELV